MTVIITSFGQWQPMQNYLKLDEHSWSAKLMQFRRRLDCLFFINERTISVKKFLSEHKKNPVQQDSPLFSHSSDLPFSTFFRLEIPFQNTYNQTVQVVYSSAAGAHYFTILATPCRNWRNNFHQLRRRRQQCAATAAHAAVWQHPPEGVSKVK